LAADARKRCCTRQFNGRINSEFNFYEKIANAELNEATAQEELINYNKPMAMVTLSLSGDDIATDRALKQLGRDPEQKRAFLRVSWTNGIDKKIHLDSRSIDGMSLELMVKNF
jgi:hypothetical protein